ncbi:MAG TPA: alpha-amylase family glycosyl hydrolase, partial [Anaerolineae bacterium]|nr:alpha-amylase family glycosyl hydrolase [Anaerolineae bacterium]
YLNDGDPAGGQDLGVTGLWLMPVAASPSYHGYDVTDYTTVNPDYGSNDEFRALVAELHRRGVRVIVDMVLNHTSDQHPWFLDSASGPEAERREWYIWADEHPGYSGPQAQTVWHEKDGAYYYGFFDSSMPDLNLQNPEVTAALYEVARFWIEEMDVDGFRLDAARHYVEEGRTLAHTEATHAWLQEFYQYSLELEPEILTVAEVWDVSDVVATYAGTDVDLAFEFSLAKAILLSVNEGGVTPLASALKEIQRLYPRGGYATFLTNHDQNRVMDALGRDETKARLAATILLTLPGVPFLYYGEEIGMTGSKPDPQIRTPMQWTAGPQAGFTSGTPWQPPNAGYEERNVEVLAADPASLLSHYRSLIALRQAHPALSSPDLTVVESAGRTVFSYLRTAGEEAVLVVVNLGIKEVDAFALTGRESPLAAGRYTARDLLTGAGVEPLVVGEGGAVESYQPVPVLPPHSALILELEPAVP